MAAAGRTQTTFHYERLRALSSGVLETAATTFLLLIAVRWHHGGPLSKALIATGGSLGLMLSPWFVLQVERLGWPVALAASRLSVVGAAAFLVMAIAPALPIYVAGCVLALTTTSASVPLLTQLYQENYPPEMRGRLFARTMMARVATAAVFGHMAGVMLSGHFERFRWLLVMFAAASGFAAWCLGRCPSPQLSHSGGTHPFHALKYVRRDRVFRQTLIAWMFIGFAMLMMAPLRVEFLANPKHGITLDGKALTAAMVATLTTVIPNLARLAMNPVWGRLFDRMNFFTLRLALNLGFAAGIVSFFAMGSLPGLVIGAVLFGVANAGADVAWSLWVTKFAPAGRVADYMSVHTFFTGLRGMLAPVVAFYLVADMPVRTLGWISVGLIAAGSLVLVPEIKFGRKALHGDVLVEEVSD